MINYSKDTIKGYKMSTYKDNTNMTTILYISTSLLADEKREL